MTTPLAAQELPKQYDHKAAQDRWYSFWLERGYFHSEPDPERRPYTIVIPPPNVTGALHLGHALNNSLQDILIRWRRMQGYNALWMPGTDHAGIATQAVVERRLFDEEKKTRHDLGRQALVERIWEWKNEYEARILGQLARLGCSCDWQRTRFTLDDTCARAVRHTFFGLFREQLIYRGKRLVNWDTHLQTAVSDDEVTHETVAGHFYHLRYPIINPQPGEPAFVCIATTRPETMLGDTAVAVHPDPDGALDKAEAELHKRLSEAPAKEKAALQLQLDALFQRRQTHVCQLEQLRDMALAGRKVRLPLLNREIPLVADEWAKPELGSGCVKITPAHDPNDYEVAGRQKLPMINILNSDGTLNENAGPYQGLTVKKAREKVVADLEALSLVDQIEDREIDLAHSDRSKTPIEPYLADQWFVKMDRLAQSAMDAVIDGRVKIVPERYARGYLDWLSEKRDWPVSRQLWWGHQIPIWYAPTASEADLKKAFAGREDIVWQKDERGQWLICAQEVDLSEDAIPGHKITREVDVLDTWFSSALWPHSTLGWPEKTPELRYYYPTSTLVTNRDIITLWVARMVLTGLFNVGDVPFREVYIHPKILDGYGEGMSKSKGNGVDPLDVIDNVGADSLRFSLAYLTTETQDVRMPVEFECPHCQARIEQTKKNRVLPRIDCKKCGQPFSTQWARTPEDLALPRGAVISERFDLGRNFCNKLWNAARFALMNLEGYEPGPVLPWTLPVSDQWILSELRQISDKVTHALENYEFGEAARLLYDFSWNTFCSEYLEIIKRRLDDKNTRTIAQRVLAYCLDYLMRLLHPFIPFLTEEVWQRLSVVAPKRGLVVPRPTAESIMIAEWPRLYASKHDKEPELQLPISLFKAAVERIRVFRSEYPSASGEVVPVTLRCSVTVANAIGQIKPELESLAHVKVMEFGPNSQIPPMSVGIAATVSNTTTTPPPGSMLPFGGIYTVVSSTEIFPDLEGRIDVEAETARKTKELEKLAGAIAGKERQLSNANFVDRAPAEVIEKERAALAQLHEQKAAAERALAALKLARK